MCFGIPTDRPISRWVAGADPLLAAGSRRVQGSPWRSHTTLDTTLGARSCGEVEAEQPRDGGAFGAWVRATVGPSRVLRAPRRWSRRDVLASSRRPPAAAHDGWRG